MAAENMDDEIEIKLNDMKNSSLLSFIRKTKYCGAMTILTETIK